jgi:hypothetical protein
LQIVEEDLIEFVVVVLAGMNKDVIARFVQPRDDPRQENDLGPRANDRHDSQTLHQFSLCA